MALTITEDRILKELLRLYTRHPEVMEQIKEGFMSGIIQSQNSRGTWNREVLKHLAEEPGDDFALAAFQAKALGWFTRGVAFLPFIQELIKTRNKNFLATAVMILRQKGFNTDYLVDLMKARFEEIRSDKESHQFDMPSVAKNMEEIYAILRA